MRVCAVIPCFQEELRSSALEVLTKSAGIAASSGGHVEAWLMGPTAEKHSSKAAQYGAATLRVIDLDVDSKANGVRVSLGRRIVDAVERLMSQSSSEGDKGASSMPSTVPSTVPSSSPTLLLFDNTELTKDVLGACGARLDAPVIADVVDLSWDGHRCIAQRPTYASKVMSTVHAEAPTILCSIRAGLFEPVEKPVDAASHHYDPPKTDLLGQVLKELVAPDGDTVDLTEAPIILGVGRGVADEAGKDLVAKLATLIGGEIAISRAHFESGMYSHTLLVGQSGKVVAPRLYLALGISGSIQHVAGMSESHTIIAINKDPEAPIFELADLGIVGDLYQILPALIDALESTTA
jgi:electron transfer flavoprotein alpha subunit